MADEGDDDAPEVIVITPHDSPEWREHMAIAAIAERLLPGLLRDHVPALAASLAWDSAIAFLDLERTRRPLPPVSKAPAKPSRPALPARGRSKP